VTGLCGKACAAGRAGGWLDAGASYAKGEGVAKDATRAAELYRAACEKGNAEGCFRAGSMLASGVGGAKDERQAAAFYRKACDRGNGEGCYLVAVDATRSSGKDDAKTAALDEKACEGSFARGGFRRGGLQTGGTGVARSETVAAKRYYKAGLLFLQADKADDVRSCVERIRGLAKSPGLQVTKEALGLADELSKLLPTK